MVQVSAGENDACAMIVLSPNNSAGWRGNQRFLTHIAGVSLVIAGVCLIYGAPLVLLFSGLELLALFFALRIVSWHCSRQEVIELTPYEVVVQTGHYQPEKQWRWQRLHTRVELRNDYRGILIRLTCQKQSVGVGDFLTEKERTQLVGRLQKLVCSYQRLYMQ